MDFNFDTAFQLYFINEFEKMMKQFEPIFKRSDEYDQEWMFKQLLSAYTTLSMDVTKSVLKDYHRFLTEKFLLNESGSS